MVEKIDPKVALKELKKRQAIITGVFSVFGRKGMPSCGMDDVAIFNGDESSHLLLDGSTFTNKARIGKNSRNATKREN